jgi:hypothetical protein
MNCVPIINISIIESIDKNLELFYNVSIISEIHHSLTRQPYARINFCMFNEISGIAIVVLVV